MIAFKQAAINVINAEIEAIEGLKQYITDDFDIACKMILDCTGKIVVTGRGKSGRIGCKVAATRASTGTPACFGHPGEASHGDVRMTSETDLVIAIAKSGEPKEVLAIIPRLKRRGIKIIGMR